MTDAVIGNVDCVGDEAELFECYHSSIGVHSCGTQSTASDPEVVISCYGMSDPWKI